MRSVLRRLLDQAGFSPRQLFAALQGAWLEPKVELGPELVTNGDFSNGTTGWNVEAGWTIGSGVASLSEAHNSGYANLYQANKVTAGRTYQISIDVISAPTAGVVKVRLGAATYGPAITSTGKLVYTLTAETTGLFGLQHVAGGSAGTTAITVDNISVREVTSGTNIWQENTGVTPTTTGGQTIGLLLDQSQGAVLGPELVTNGDFSNGTTGWLPYGTGNNFSVVNGQLVAVDDCYQGITGLTVGKAYRITYQVISGSGLFFYSKADCSSGAYAINQTAGVYTVVSTSTELGLYLYSGTIDNISVRQILGNHAYQATANQRPTLQFSGALPLARFDTTDFLSVSLPAINVRRNLLTYSEQFDNAAWVKQGAASIASNTTLAPDGTPTADTLTISSGNYCFQICTVTTGNTYTLSLYVKVESVTKQFYLNIYGTGGIVMSGVLTATTNWQRFALTFTASGTGTTNFYAPIVDGLPNGAFYIWGAQLELGSVATDYQKITDWTSEAYSSNGSVYFATPVGMSQLNNQSMGQTYTLPALSSDIYSWMVFPQRLNTAQESKLAQYMQQKAGIAGPDILRDSVRRNLLTWTQDFSNGSWVKQDAPILTYNVGLAPDGTSTACLYSAKSGRYVYQGTSVISGSTYTLSIFVKTSGGSPQFKLNVYGSGNNFIGETQTATADWMRFSLTFTATGTGVAGIHTIIVDTLPDGEFYIWGAQLELGSTATTYQRIDAGPDPYVVEQEQLTADDGEQLLLAQ